MPSSSGQALHIWVPLTVGDFEPGHPAEGISEMETLSPSFVCPEFQLPFGMLLRALLVPFSRWPLGSGPYLFRFVVRAEMDLILSVPFITTKAKSIFKKDHSLTYKTNRHIQGRY